MWVCPYTICVCPVAFGETAGSEVSIGPIFLLNVLAATTLMAGKRGDERATARARCELELFLCSIATTVLWGGVVLGPKKLEKKT